MFHIKLIVEPKPGIKKVGYVGKDHQIVSKMHFAKVFAFKEEASPVSDLIKDSMKKAGLKGRVSVIKAAGPGKVVTSFLESPA